MTERKYAHYFVTRDKPNLKLPVYRHTTDPATTKRLAYIDEETVEGAEFGVENFWLMPGGPAEQKLMDASKENFDRFIGFYSYNYDDTRDLCAEVEITIDGETHTVPNSFAAFVPAGIEVGPVTIRNITRPVFVMFSQPCGDAVK